MPSSDPVVIEPEQTRGPQPTPAGERVPRWLRPLTRQPWRSVLLSFLAARLIVAGVLVVCAQLPGHGPWKSALLGWDAVWYQTIAHLGYAGTPAEGIRFFPLLPLVTRAVSVLTFGHVGIALLLVANGCALLYALLAHRLALREGLTPEAAARVPWVIALAPAGFVLVMGYTEPLYGVLVCVVFLQVRSRRWLTAAVAGVLIGALRPTGVIMGLPILIEAVRGLRGASWKERAARVVAVASPAVGLAAYLAWVGYRFGDPLLPARIQTESALRSGILVNPLPSLSAAVQALLGRSPGTISPLVHLLVGVLAVALLIGCARRLPPSYTAFAAVTVLLALSGRGLQSLERYTASAVPLLLVAAVWLCTQRRKRVAETAAAVVLAGASLLAFMHLYVP